MNLEQLIHLKRQYGRHVPGYIDKSSREQDATLINQAMRTIGRFCHVAEARIPFYPEANRAEYELRNPSYFGRLTTRPHRAYVAGMAMVDDEGNNRVQDIAELDDMDQWRFASAGMPTQCARTSNGKLVFNCPFSEAVAAMGRMEIYGEYLPGALGDNGTYYPHGFPTVFGSSDDSAGVDSGNPATVAAFATPYDGTLTAPAGALATGGGAVSIVASNPASNPDNAIVVIRDIGLTIPIGAVVQWVRIKSLRMKSTNGCRATFAWGTNATVSIPLAPQQSADVPGDGTYAEYGPFPAITTLGAFDATSANFGLQLGLSDFVSGAPGPLPVAEDYDLTIDELTVEVGYVATSTSAGMTWETAATLSPDIPVEFHEAIAYIAAIINANPMLDNQSIVASLANVKSETYALLKQLKSDNLTAIAGLYKPQRLNAPNHYWVGR